MRILIDVNVYISYLLSDHGKGRTIREVIQICTTGTEITLLVGQLIGDELLKKVHEKIYLRQRIREKDLETFINLLFASGETVFTPEKFLALSRDPKDDYLLAYAVAGRADYLVTGDEDLLEMKEYGGVKIVSPSLMLVIVDK